MKKSTSTTVFKSMALLVASMLLLTGCLGTESTDLLATTPGASESTDSDANANTDTGGTTDEPEAPAPESVKVVVEVAEPNDTEKVTLGAAASPVKGGVATIAVRVRMFEPWHIYAIDKPTGVGIASKLALELPDGVAAVGEWELPDPKQYEEDIFIYAKDVTFRRQVQVGSSVTGPIEVGCKVSYQACSDTSCLAPTSTVVKTTVPASE